MFLCSSAEQYFLIRSCFAGSIPGPMRLLMGCIGLITRNVMFVNNMVLRHPGQYRVVRLIKREALIGCLYLGIGYVVFNRFERLAKWKGSLKSV